MGVTASRTLSVAATPTDLCDVTFRSVEPSRYPEILELLYANFHTDEPMSRALNIYDGVHRVPAVDEYTLNALNEKLSIMAVDAITNKLLGVAINGRCCLRRDNSPEDSSSSSSPQFSPNSTSVGDAKFRHILGALKEVNLRARPSLLSDLSHHHQSSDANDIFLFDIKMVTTDKQNRRSGLGTDLLRRSVELARSLGYTACKTEATGQYSRKAFERIGFTAVSELPYAEVVDPATGEPVFKSMSEKHRGVTLLTKRLVQEETVEEEDEVEEQKQK